MDTPFWLNDQTNSSSGAECQTSLRLHLAICIGAKYKERAFLVLLFLRETSQHFTLHAKLLSDCYHD